MGNQYCKGVREQFRLDVLYLVQRPSFTRLGVACRLLFWSLGLMRLVQEEGPVEVIAEESAAATINYDMLRLPEPILWNTEVLWLHSSVRND